MSAGKAMASVEDKDSLICSVDKLVLIIIVVTE